jgi:hypothetical protein
MAEHHAAILKGMYRDGAVSQSVYQHGETLYVAAKAAIDGWLEIVIVDLELEGEVEVSATQRNKLEEAAINADTFVQFVAALTEDPQRSVWGEAIKAIPDTFTALVDGGLDIWREIRSQGAAKRAALVKRLEDLRWKVFAEIPATDAAPD